MAKVELNTGGQAKSHLPKHSLLVAKVKSVRPLGRRSFFLCGVLFLCAAVAAKGAEQGLGSRKNPVKIAMVPSHDSTKILSSMEPIASCLKQKTGLYFDVSVPTNFIVVVESMGSKRIDVAFLNTFGYLLAAERYGVVPILKSSRQGESTYRGQIIVKASSNINKISDLSGKKMAFVDPASTSGHIAPKGLLAKEGVKLREEVFAGNHDAVVTMVYQGQVDAGATFYNPPKNAEPRDARKNVKTQFPDVFAKVKILALTDDIPNDPLVVRKDFPADIRVKIQEAMVSCVEKNREAFMGLNSSDALVPVTDADYDGVRKLIKSLKIDLGNQLGKGK